MIRYWYLVQWVYLNKSATLSVATIQGARDHLSGSTIRRDKSRGLRDHVASFVPKQAVLIQDMFAILFLN